MGMTRRQFVERVGAVGFGAAFTSMQALGMLPVERSSYGGPRLAPASGRGSSVVILGAGVSGLAAAYELQEAGYRVDVLEATDRCGGRNHTIRRGDVITEVSGARQVCEWDEGLYFNAGPARISSQHFRVLDYCRRFGIPLEVQITTNRAARYHDDRAFGGAAVEGRRLHYDTRGYVSELLSKCIHQGALDEELDARDRQRMLAFLQDFGDLAADGRYKGSSRAGYARPPGGGMDFGEINPALPFDELLSVDFWGWMFNEDEMLGHQATMFQPRGGMDRIVTGFVERLAEGTVRLGCPVIEIRNTPEGVEVVYAPVGESGGSATPRVLGADFCITTIPYAGFRNIESNFSERKRAALKKGGRYENSVKTAWQSRRWWEEDLGIYGGVSYTTRDIEQIWYPSDGFFGDSGILISSYNDGEVAERWHHMTPEQRASAARLSTDRVHPGYGKELRAPISMSWMSQPYAWGAWPAWEPDDSAEVTAFYEDIVRPEERVYFAGDIASLWAGWMEGGFAAAHDAIAAIDLRRRQGGAST